MMGFFQSVYVIARRDFVATVWSRTFLFFLIGPLVIIGFSLAFGTLTSKMARADVQATVAVVASKADFARSSCGLGTRRSKRIWRRSAPSAGVSRTR